MKKILSITTLILIVLTTSAQQPAWQWIKSGGSIGSSSSWKESCVDIGTDAHGNVYGISYIFNWGIVVDTVQKPQGFGYEDFCVFSYACDGSFRWVKFFGSSLPDKVGGIAVDSEGNVYVSGSVATGEFGDAHFGDSIVPQTTYPIYDSQFVGKLDSNGKIVWLNLPYPTPTFTHKAVNDIELDNKGNLNVLVWINDSTTWDGIAVPGKGVYFAKFDKDDGHLFELVPLQYYAKHSYQFFSIDTDNSIYMMSGVSDTLFLGNDTIFDIDTLYQTLLIKFSPLGNKVWYTEVEGVSGTDSYQFIWGKPLIYDNYLYIGGQTQSYPGSNFFGVPIVNPIASHPSDKTKVIARFNKYTGDFVSVNNLKHINYIPLELPVSYNNNSIIASSSGGKLIILNQNDTIKPHTSPMNSAYPFIVEIDTALSHFNWGIATEAVGIPKVEVITTDDNGNIYLGGSMEGSIFNSFGDETLPAAGGGDFMIAKIAVTNDSCGCVYAIPHAQLISFVNNVLTVNGNVNNNADSLVWYWGDGSSTVYTTPGANITHTYQNSGTYTIYLRAWNSCGMKEDSLVNLTSGINTLNRNNFSMTYYPNPFTQTLTIEFDKVMKNAEIYLFDLVGKQVLHKALSGEQTIINTSAIENGIYIMKVVSGDGDLFVGKVVKND